MLDPRQSNGRVLPQHTPALGHRRHPGQSHAAKEVTQALSVEGKAPLTANPIGSALKADPAHRAATFMREEAAANGTNFAITGGDGVARTLTQVPVALMGLRGDTNTSLTALTT